MKAETRAFLQKLRFNLVHDSEAEVADLSVSPEMLAEELVIYHEPVGIQEGAFRITKKGLTLFFADLKESGTCKHTSYCRCKETL